MDSNLQKVFVARRIPQIGIDSLAQQFAVTVHSGQLPPTRSELLSGVGGCHGILSLLSDRIDGEVMDAAGAQLKVISNFAVGFNNIDVPEATRRGIAVGNTPDVLTDATADIAIALIMATARRLREAWQAVDNLAWKTWEPTGWRGLDLVGSTVGIVGMGRIGSKVAQRLYGGWNMRVLFTAHRAKAEDTFPFPARQVALDELLTNSDFISLHVPLSADTRHLIGAREFGLMKETAVVVNTARGEIINQAALVNALRNKQIFGAGLDVCDPEPLPEYDPLRQCENCLLLPHIGSATYSARDAMAVRAADNLLAGLTGNPLPYPVN
ncbi:MAG: D-glycerate dehydrogenase [Planctomycetales bacterium]|nr:D-glycerate dehydrogenase [Planctomycetales bacterium]